MAIGCAGETFKAGMPRVLRELVETRATRRFMAIIQQPVLAALLFSGSFYFWLIPSVHFRAMIDIHLYAVMNWTMVLDGILFWSLVLDPRPKPPARISFGARALLAIFVMFPQIVLGAALAFTNRDLYPSYALCGRLYPSISPVADQHIGALIIWIPPAMMSIIALLLVINALRLADESKEASPENRT
jgi:putative membrane protein